MRGRGAADVRAAGDRALGREHAVDVLFHFGGKTPHLRERQLLQTQARFFGEAHRPRDGFVSVAKRDSLPYQVVGEVCRRGEAFLGRSLHRSRVDLDAGDQFGEDGERIAQGVRRVEQRLLVLLIVLVVSKSLSLHQGKQRDEIARDSTGLAARELRNVGILLLGHDGRAGAKAIRQGDETEARIAPQNQLFGQTREMDHRERCTSAEFDREIPVGDRVQRVCTHRFEPQLARDLLAVDRKGGSGERSGPEREAVHAPPAVGKARAVALEHLKIREQVVPESDRLSDLQVGETRHHGGGMFFGLIDESPLHSSQ